MQSKVFDLILILWHLEAIYENKACTNADTIRLGNEGKVKIFIHSVTRPKIEKMRLIPGLF